MRSTAEVLVVGAGFAGLATIKKLRDEGIDVLAVERGHEVGGTWYWNRYPGLRCDVESMHYSYSWDEELQQQWRWHERYASQPEILEYARHVADRFDLRQSIRFGADVISMEFDETNEQWAVTLQGGDVIATRWIIMATGALSKPKTPEIAGLNEFSGEVFHTADWPEGEVSFANKRVAVVGTGSSGIQVSTEIAKDVGHLHVLQRTPSYSMPARNRDLSEEEVAEWQSRYPAIREDARHSLDGLSGRMTGLNTFDVDASERRRIYEEVYATGVPFTFFGIFNDILFNEEANRTVHEFWADKIRERVEDQEIAEKLIPSGYPFGTRRCCIDTGYYEIYNQDNVTLVPLLETPLERVTESGVLVRDQQGGTEHVELDSLVIATGYDAFTGALARIDVVGRDGTRLVDVWQDGAVTYLGAAVSGFPNLFIVTGPLSPAVLSNMVLSIEQHVDWIIGAVCQARDEGATLMEVTPEAQKAWVDHAQAIAESTLHRKSTSWYSGGNIEGKPRFTLPYVGGVGPFRQEADRVAAEGYRGFARNPREEGDSVQSDIVVEAGSD